MTGTVIRSGGVAMSLRLPRGPCFLGELLPVDVALANHSRRTITLDGKAVPNPCGTALGAVMTGGTPSPLARSISTGMGCPWPGMTQLAPGRGLTMHQWLTLTSSGRVTVAAQAMFLRVSRMSGGGQSITNGPNPLGGRWPAVRMSVAASAPAGRTLSLIHVGPAVFVGASLSVRPRLLCLYGVACTDLHGTGRTFSGSFGWQPIPSGVVYDPGCPGKNEQWTVTVGAPGYAIATATYQGRGEGKL